MRQNAMLSKLMSETSQDIDDDELLLDQTLNQTHGSTGNITATGSTSTMLNSAVASTPSSSNGHQNGNGTTTTTSGSSNGNGAYNNLSSLSSSSLNNN